jgi:hypothetical protein
MLGSKQNIQSGDNSTNIQGQTITINAGLSYPEVKQVALDVFQSNFFKLSNEAALLATQRAEELTADFLEKLQERNAGAIESMKEPDMQYALLMAQKEYARSGDKDLSEVLVDILVERASIQERNLLQIVLNECVEIIPKLTNGQIDYLSLIFILRYTKKLHFDNLNDFVNYIESIGIFLKNNTKESSSFQHLEYAGCGAIGVMDVKLEDQFRKNYSGLFSKGFTQQELDSVLNGVTIPSSLIMPCLNDNNLLQIGALYDKRIEDLLEGSNVGIELLNDIKQLQNSKIMQPQEIKNVLIDLHPTFKELFDTWDNSHLKVMTLTSVGIAIGHANLRRKISDHYDLNIWIK